jgi:hypothetical protein
MAPRRNDPGLQLHAAAPAPLGGGQSGSTQAVAENPVTVVYPQFFDFEEETNSPACEASQ